MKSNTVTSILEHKLKERVHYGPVTALKFLDQARILVGYGPFLRLLCVDRLTGTVEQIWQQRVFKRNKIHRISVASDKLTAVVAGGRSFAIVNFEKTSIMEKAINEWIIAIDCSNSAELLILTSHNEVLQISISPSGQKADIVAKKHCNEKSILYSGSIQRCSNGRVYVAAGTVMNGVLIWDLHTQQILHNLTDHEGSIFAVEIDVDAQYLISCSDDRSIKLFSFPSGKLLASGWGHSSRIWTLLFYEVSDMLVKISSAGEDCSARVWFYEASSTALKQTKCFDMCHEGKHIWSSDADSQHWQCLVTGGADGKARLLDVSCQLDEATIFERDEIERQAGMAFEKKEIIKQFVALPNIKGFIVMTSSGRVFSYNITQGWGLVELPNEQSMSFKDFAILRSFASSNHIVLCSRAGDLLVLRFLDLSPQPIHFELIKNTFSRPIKVINVLSWSSADRLLLLLVSPSDKFPLLAKEFEVVNGKVSLTGTHELANPAPRAFIPTSVDFDAVHRCLFVGSRHANLAVYSLHQTILVSPYVIRKICPGDTVTSISKVHSTDGHVIVLVTVRDGIYILLKVAKLADSFTHEIIHQNKFTKGVLEGGLYEGNELYLYGFRSGSFFVWNETQQVEIDHEPCGGAHRQWEFLRQKDENAFRFSFIRHSSLISKQLQNKSGLLLPGTHGREIRSVALCSRDERDGSRLFALASEDSTVKVGYISHKREIACKWTMNNHVCGPQTVHFLNNEYFASSAANEELLIWKLSREVPGNIAVAEDARIRPSEENPDLRIMDIASLEGDDGFYIAAGFSNSQIKIFLYNKRERVFSVVAEDTYSTFCILNVELVRAGERALLMAGTTDGIVTVWDVSHCVAYAANLHSMASVSDLGVPKVKQQFHQSGVKALLVIPLSSGTWKLITGGDDNSLVSADLIIATDNITLVIDSFVDSAASATITGIVPAGSDLVLVTSVDQIVRRWSYGEMGLVCSAATYTTVADTGCCVSGLFDDGHFAIVGGAGLSMFEF